MTRIAVRLPSGDLRELPIYDNNAPQIEVVYLIKRYRDGTLRAVNHAYTIIGTVEMSDEEFNALKALIAQTDPHYGPPDNMDGEAYWLDEDAASRNRLVDWNRDRYRQDFGEPGSRSTS
jgi:GTP-dependent phosphoenolpyruvate carboxykinase